MESARNHPLSLNATRSVLLVLALTVVAAIFWVYYLPPAFDHKRVYRIGYGNDAPFHFVGTDGAPSGLAYELVREAARRSDIRLEWVSKATLDLGDLDLWVLVTETPERMSQMHLTEPYLQAESGFIVRVDSPVRDASELRKARISCRNLLVVRHVLEKLMPEAQIVVATENDGSFSQLAEGRADAIFIDQHVLVMSLLRGESHVPFRLLSSRSPRRPLSIGSTFASAAVADELRRSLQLMGEDGSSTPILERWTFFFDPANAIIGETARQKARVQQLVLGVLGLSVVVVAMVGLIVLTRRQAAQVRQTRKLLREVADRVPGMVFQLRLGADRSVCFLYASEAIRRIYHVGPEAVLTDGSAVLAALHPEDRDGFRAALDLSARQLTPLQYEYRVRFGDGPVQWHSCNALPQRDQEGATLFHGFITDITEAKAAEEALATFERKIQQTQKLESLGLLAGGIAHDFNNILTGILGSADLARHSLTGASPALDYIDSIKQGCRRAAELCKQMLAYSGKGRFEIRKVSLSTLVEETAQLLRLSINKQAELRLNLAPNLPAVDADVTQMRQVIMNLVINASEAIGASNGLISLSTSVMRVTADDPVNPMLLPGQPAGTYVCLEVSDTGCGMSVETQARIFDPFFTTKFTGRGLGLAAVHGIVRGHKGVLKVYSELGRGTTFKLLFPAADGAEVSPGAATAGSSRVDWRGEGCILVVDDEEAVRRALSAMLTKLGFSVVLASDGREGLERYRSEPDRFAAVLMDLTMPQLGGKEALVELRRIRENVRIVLMSGFNEEEAAPELVGKKLAGFLQKPFEFETLVGVLRNAVGGT